MTKDELLSCLTDRPCGACKFHTDLGCSKWSCVFEDKTEEWIPCEERLPEENQGVFLTVETVYGHRDVLPSIATYHKGHWWWLDNDKLGNKVIAWQYAPEPYKGEQNE